MPLSGPFAVGAKAGWAGGKPPFGEAGRPLLKRRRVTGVQSSCPPQSELGDISQYMIALGQFVFFDPFDQIDERRLPFGAGKSTMSGRPSGALNQEMRCTGLVGALSL